MAEIDISSLEPNSHKYKNEKIEKSKEKISPIIKKDQVVSTKKPFGKKFAETFMTKDTSDVKKWVIMDVIIPGIKNTILDILQMAFFGEVDSRSRGRSIRRYDERVSYSRYYGGTSRKRESEYYTSDDQIDFRNIILRNRDDAERLINAMRDRIRNSDSRSVSIAELFDLIDVPSRYTDNNYGWDDERDIGIRRVSSGYLIDVSEPKYLG